MATKWREFPPCPKCGATIPKVQYYKNCGWHEGMEEHFHFNCWRCGFYSYDEWVEIVGNPVLVMGRNLLAGEENVQ